MFKNELYVLDLVEIKTSYKKDSTEGQFEWTPGVGDERKAWRAAIHGVAESRTRLSDWTELKGSLGEMMF